MNFPIAAGIQVSLDYNESTNTGTWYKLSDHGRNPIGIQYELVQQQQRMANGTMRHYVVARKFKITADWKDLPTLDSNVVDYSASQYGPFGAAWIRSFYEKNAFYPIWVKLTVAQDTGSLNSNALLPDPATYQDSLGVTNSGLPGDNNTSGTTIYNAFMTTFTYDVTKRMNPSGSTQGYDYVNVKIEFTEI